VDAAQVIAVPVLAGRHVVVTVRCHRTVRALPGAAPLAAESGIGKRLDVRGDHERVHRRERARQLAQPERIEQAHRQRSDLVTAARLTVDVVADIDRASWRESLHDDAGPPAEQVGNRVLDQEQPGWQPGHVLYSQHGAGAAAGFEPRGFEPTGTRQPEPGPYDEHCGDKWECEQQQAQPQQVGLLQHDPGQGGSDAGGKRAATAQGQRAKREPKHVHGVLTLAAGDRFMSPRLRHAARGGGRHGHGSQDVGQDGRHGASRDLGIGGQQQAVGKNRLDQSLQVVRKDVVTLIEGSNGAAGAEKMQRGPG
jgi:hypothetical protein